MSLKCTLCPHGCSLSEGQVGICRVRGNTEDRIQDRYFGILSALSMDPIEKKPLYHYHPGKMVLSAGFFGCSFRCPFCQNYRISQTPGNGRNPVSPMELVETALQKESFAIAYTYSEPIVHLEYLLETAELAGKQGLKNILVSNGFINPEPGKKLIKAMDAANIDLKSFNDDFYKKELKGTLAPVLDFISMAAESIHLEVTTLVIPGKNDSVQEITDIVQFISSLDDKIPLHLSAYYPQYKYSRPGTDPAKLIALAETAEDYLSYVYPGNIGLAENNTFCSDCGKPIIKRRGYQLDLTGLDGSRCCFCGTESPINFN